LKDRQGDWLSVNDCREETGSPRAATTSGRSERIRSNGTRPNASNSQHSGWR